ncbi:hypothetical protein R50073_13400 [Maricurvus nonylphenolicus]|uniref:VOC family protein n=1 Tax=Maricurvus nonylphenolicus TaxID=1008307 RepID=UPI0036F275EE
MNMPASDVLKTNSLSPNNFSHLEFNTRDLKPQLEYFSDVLGMPLVSIRWADKTESSVRAMLKLNEHAMISFLCTLRTPSEVELGVTHSENPGDATTTGTVQHTALNVDSIEDLLAIRDRIRSRGVHCVGPMDHGFCQSIYFLGPDSLALEVATLTTDDMTQWIDPNVAEAIGLSAEEMIKLGR